MKPPIWVVDTNHFKINPETTSQSEHDSNHDSGSIHRKPDYLKSVELDHSQETTKLPSADSFGHVSSLWDGLDYERGTSSGSGSDYASYSCAVTLPQQCQWMQESFSPFDCIQRGTICNTEGLVRTKEWGGLSVSLGVTPCLITSVWTLPGGCGSHWSFVKQWDCAAHRADNRGGDWEKEQERSEEARRMHRWTKWKGIHFYRENV